VAQPWWLWISLAAVAACGYPRPADVGDDVSDDQRLAGRVHGLWDGAEGVGLRLEADGIDTRLTVSTNGAFEFSQPLAQGASYTVTVETSPSQHSCVVAAGGSGRVSDAALAEVAVACTGPLGVLTLSGPWAWTFDPTEEQQTFDGSIAVQDVALAVYGSDLLSMRVADQAVTIGQVTAPIRLALGMTMVPVALTASGGLSKTYQLVFQRGGTTLEQVVYGKASNTGANQGFGRSLAVFDDTLVVGAPGESSNATGVDGNQLDTSADSAGAVYVFVRQGAVWMQQAYLKASNTGKDDGFGSALALSGDVLAVGAPGESSGSPSNQHDDSVGSAGAVYLFTRTGTSWFQVAYVKASNPGSEADFGRSVALSGNTLAVGAPGEASSASGVDPPGGQADDSAPGTGAVYVYVRGGATWSQQAYLKASNTGGRFGQAVTLSGDSLVVGAPDERSHATGVNGDQADTSAKSAGAAYVFGRANAIWTQQAYLKASNTEAEDEFGYAVSLSGDTLAVGALDESSAATGINPVGEASDNHAFTSGAVFVFVRHDATWSQEAYIKASNTDRNDQFGQSVALSGDTLVVGSSEASAATGVNGDQSSNAAPSAGAAYVFTRRGTTWSQPAYVKASNTGTRAFFGYAVAASNNTVVVGAFGESSRAMGINPGNGQTDTSADGAGAVYVFR
jgi:FG-GAP repeat